MKIFRKPRIELICLSACAVLLSACASMQAPKDIVDTAAANPKYSTLSKAINAAGLSETLKGSGPYTVFAPTNEAFARMKAGDLDKLMADPAQLKAVLTYHVIPSALMAKDVIPGKIKTVNGASVEIAKAGDFITVDEAVVIDANMSAANGVIHGVDRVLMLPKK